MPSARARRRLGRLFVLGLGVARIAAGTVQTASPRTFLGLLGTPDTPAQTQMGFRMKGGRDLALGLLTLASRDDDDRLADLALAAVVLDGVDGVAVALDRGRTLGAPVDPAGAVLGFAVAGMAVWAARSLRPG
jgi:hypothetical protein